MNSCKCLVVYIFPVSITFKRSFHLGSLTAPQSNSMREAKESLAGDDMTDFHDKNRLGLQIGILNDFRKKNLWSILRNWINSTIDC